MTRLKNSTIFFFPYRCESMGVTDIKVFVEGLQANTTLTELDFSRNDISDKLGLAKGLAESLMVSL